MTTQAEYDAGTAAGIIVCHKDIARDVPGMFQSQIPAQKIAQHSAEMAKAIIDAAEKARQ